MHLRKNKRVNSLKVIVKISINIMFYVGPRLIKIANVFHSLKHNIN